MDLQSKDCNTAQKFSLGVSPLPAGYQVKYSLNVIDGNVFGPDLFDLSPVKTQQETIPGRIEEYAIARSLWIDRPPFWTEFASELRSVFASEKSFTIEMNASMVEAERTG